VLKAIDTDLFTIERYFEDDINDWGMAVVRRK
jgi:hypothetical protein